MIHKIKTYSIEWLIGHEITIEVATNKSLPTIEIIWLPDIMIKESKERIRSALRNSAIDIPPRKFILNLSPSDIRKSGTSFDLPIAVALFWSIFEWSVYQEEILTKSLFFGELGLDGELKRIDGLLPMVISAKKSGYRFFFIPQDNLYEIEYIHWIFICPIKHFKEIMNYFLEKVEIPFIQDNKSIEWLKVSNHADADFIHIKWQHIAKRALSIAASGLHNTLMIWSPWCGKTLLAKTLQSILPPLHPEEVLEVSQIYSIVWQLHKDQPLIIKRPYRGVHHTASKVSLVGGGSSLRPGEISLAHRWILFLDELTEFPRETLEVLRQPLEDRTINISRVSWTVSYPADFMFVAAMNPCKCWYLNDPEKPCSCTTLDIKKYQSKISGPLLDRMDLVLEIPREHIETLLSKINTSESSEQLKEKVLQSREIQQKRYINTNIHCNAQLSTKEIEKFIILEWDTKEFIYKAQKKLQLSNRAVHKVLKLARSIADFASSDNIQMHHISESLQYRNKWIFASEQ